MKQFIAIILVTCLTLTLFAGCQSSTVDTEAPGATPPTEEVTGKNPSTPTDPSNPTDPSDPSNPSNPTDPTDPTDPTNPSDPTDPTKPIVKGERISDEQFNALCTNSPTNYTYTQSTTYNGATQEVTMMINGKDYLQVRVLAGATRKILGIWQGTYSKDYMYNEETGKWETSNTGISTTFPLASIPFALSDFTFDEATGTYRMVVAADLTGEIVLKFLDGNLVYVGQIADTYEDHAYFFDYGTTVIPMPDASDIVDKDNSTNTWG